MDNKAIKLIDMVLTHEGGYAFVDGDTGQETYRGISRKYHPNWEGWKQVDANKPLKHNQIIKNETLENNVRQFYNKYYYTPMKIHKINNLMISGHVFCHGVNAGKATAIKLLQKAINKVYAVSIAVDGIIGNQTLTYANGDKQNEVANELINQRNEYYRNLVAKKPSQKKFLNGWLNRVKNTTKVCSSKSVLTTSIMSNGFISKIINFILKIIKALVKK